MKHPRQVLDVRWRSATCILAPNVDMHGLLTRYDAQGQSTWTMATWISQDVILVIRACT